MKKIILISHCVLNSYCELPKAPDELRKDMLEILMNQDVSIVQLPCPELSYQGLERESIHPGDEKAKDYEQYCKELLKPVIKDIQEYNANDVEIIGIIGIDTSPSCSVINKDAIMMKLLREELNDLKIDIKDLLDMPVTAGENRDQFLSLLHKICL